MSPNDYMAKASRAIASAKLLLDAGDVDGACNRAFRLLADYTGEEVAADKARWAVEQAGAFVGTVQQTLAPPKPTSGSGRQTAS